MIKTSYHLWVHKKILYDSNINDKLEVSDTLSNFSWNLKLNTSGDVTFFLTIL